MILFSTGWSSLNRSFAKIVILDCRRYNRPVNPDDAKHLQKIGQSGFAACKRLIIQNDEELRIPCKDRILSLNNTGPRGS